jgi:tRNA-5-methyluridine54 2-sulfurtransferase
LFRLAVCYLKRMESQDIEIAEERCTICGASTQILRLTEFNLKTCKPCFIRFYERRVRRTIEQNDMLGEGDRLVLSVSGGKDSTALLFALRRLSAVMGFELLTVHFHLDMGDYSDANLDMVEEQTGLAGVPLRVVQIGDFGLRVQRVKGWHPCAVCGAIRRSLLNRETRRMGASAVATAHTLEDILLFTFKNLLSRKLYTPPAVLPRMDGMARKIKPLVHTPERLNRAYCHMREVPFFEEKCPEWSPSGHSLKEVFEHMEALMPSSKLQLLLSMQEVLPAEEENTNAPMADCPHCGEPTSQSVCALCQLADWFAAGEGARERVDLS